MVFNDILGGMVSFGLLAWLAFALTRPERF
jgi:K+-transporting ATPase KdpF subunit